MFERLRQRLDALADPQQPATLDRQAGRGLKTGGVESLEPPENLVELREQVETTPLLKWPIQKFATDVVSPGIRVDADSDATVDFFMGGDAAPSDAPEEGFLAQAAIEAGETNKDIQPLVKRTVALHESPGTALIEHVRADPDDPDAPITGFKLIDPLTVHPQVYDRQTILLDPGDTDLEDAVTTPRGEAAAYIQFHDNSPLGQWGAADARSQLDETDEVALSQNDVTKLVRDPDQGSVFGTPVNAPVAERVTALQEKLEDNEQAIKTKAHGIWSVAFGREYHFEHLEFAPGEEIDVIEWDDKSQQAFLEDKVGSLGPGEVVGHDGAIDFEKFEGEIADGLVEFIELDIKYILAALPVPKYLTGFEDDVNRDVTSEQAPAYEQSVQEMRDKLERELTPMLRMVAEDRGLSTEGLRLTLEPPEDDSPVMSLDDETVARAHEFAQTIERLENSTLLTDEEIRSHVLQLPEEPDLGDADEEGLDESDPQVQAQLERMREQMESPAPPELREQQAQPPGGEQEQEADD